MTSDSPGCGELVQAENEVIQSSQIDLRVDGISQEEIYNDKQHMNEVTKQVDEPTSKSMNKDL